MTNTDSVLITAEQESSCERWEMPQVQGRLPGYDVSNTGIKPPTATELKELQKQAYDEAYQLGREEGLQQGYAEGHEKAVLEFQKKSEILDKVLLNLHSPLEELDHAVEQSIVELIALISRHLVRRELKHDEGEIVGAVREAMSMLPLGSRHTHIYLNPDDIEIVREALSLGEEERKWKLEPDPLLSRGGCLVETQSSFIDASMESRLSALIASMLGGERESDQR